MCRDKSNICASSNHLILEMTLYLRIPGDELYIPYVDTVILLILHINDVSHTIEVKI